MANRRTFLARAAALLAVSGTACSSPPAEGAVGRLVRLEVIDRASGETLTEHRHRGATWVAGRPGDRFALRLSNRSGGRVLVVLSVDGVNAVTGQTADVTQSGYVLGPWQTADIVGWRKSDAEVAAFYFTALPDSYAARTDRPQNVGVIGAAVFRESPPRPVPFEPPPAISGRVEGATGPTGGPAGAAGSRDATDSGRVGQASQGGTREQRAEGSADTPRSTSSRAATAPAAAAEAAPVPRAERLGTGHGEREISPIRRTAFERASSQPNEVLQVRYDSVARLVAAGIVPPAMRPWAPEPFPGYVPDPR